MPKSLNEKLQDNTLIMQGKRVSQWNWIAAIVDGMYVDAWTKAFSGDTANSRPFRGLTTKASEFIQVQLSNMWRVSYLESWERTVTAMPQGLRVAVNTHRKLREQEEEENANPLQETPVQSDNTLPQLRKLPKTPPKPYKNLSNLWNPLSETQINTLNLQSEWKKVLRNSSNEQNTIKEITRGVAAGESNRTIARKIRSLVNNDKTRASRIARTEAARMNIAAQEKSSRDALGNSLREWKYVATLDTRTRPHHAERDGRLYTEKETRPLLPDGPNCRCVYTPITKDFAELGFPELEGLFGPAGRASMNGEVPADETYSKWFNKQPSDTQKKIIGTTRFNAMSKSRGKVKWSGFVNAKNSPAKQRALATVKGNRANKRNIKVNKKF